MPVPTAQPKIRFGAFELDRETAELYKNGAKLKLQGQPIAVLALLLERPGELVAASELRTAFFDCSKSGSRSVVLALRRFNEF